MGGGGRKQAATPRRLSTLLLAGVYVMPVVFVWVLLRPGYSSGLRTSAFAWLIFNLLPPLALLAAA